MIKATVKYFGNDKNEYGMPIPYHSYLVVSSPWQKDNSGIASVILLSGESPLPSSPHKLVMSGGEKAAYEKMIKILTDMHDGLNVLIDKD